MSHDWYEWRAAPLGDFAVLGDPIHHSLSPAMHTAGYEAEGLDLIYRAVRVEPDDWDTALQHLTNLGYRGVNVTLPHKERAFAWCEAVEGSAQLIGAVNTIRLTERTGCNTDAPTLVALAVTMGIQPPDTVLVLGAGGTGRTAAIALGMAGFTVRLWNRTQSRADEVAAILPGGISALAEPDLAGVRAVFNTTSATIRGEELTLDWDQAGPDLKLFDAGYGYPSAFLEEGRRRGLAAWDGKLMLAAQGALAWEWWLGIPAPRAAMLEAIR